MLVLSRKTNEQIVIGADVVITVVAICGDKVRLGINAPKEISVHRREVFDAIAQQQGETHGKDQTEVEAARGKDQNAQDSAGADSGRGGRSGPSFDPASGRILIGSQRPS